MADNEKLREVLAGACQLKDGDPPLVFWARYTAPGRPKPGLLLRFNIHCYGDTYSLMPENPVGFGGLGLEFSGLKPLLLFLLGQKTTCRKVAEVEMPE